jgi:ParB-like chromosome segregation protein Spo0J
MANPEIICDCEIHPAASVFPLMEGDRFQALVDSIAVHGVLEPIVWSGNVVLDGRNRLRAVDKLRCDGRQIDLPSVRWESVNGMSEVEWITTKNLDRRHLSEDAYVAAQAALSRILRKEAKARQSASTFDSEKASKAAKARHTAESNSSPPQKRDTKSKDAASTAGQVAAKAGVSMHKAKQAVALDRAVESGAIPADVQRDVIAGKTKLRDAVAMVASSAKPSAGTRASKQSATASVRRRLGGKLEHKLLVLLSQVRAKVELLEQSTSKDSTRRQRVADELRKLADRLTASK